MYREPDVMTRSGQNDPIHDMLRKAVCVPTKRYLWVPEDAITFVPALCDTIYGDGRALFRLATINSRPAFYVIRADSSWEESNWYSGPHLTFGQMTDRIYEDLETQFGRAQLDSEEDDPELLEDGHYPWPALDDENGSGWRVSNWPEEFSSMIEWVLGDFGWRSHSILRREYACEDQVARWLDDGGPAIERAFY